MALISMFYPYDILPKPSLIITLRQGPWGQYILFEKKLVLFKFGLGKWSWAMGPKVVNFLKRTCNSALIYMTSLIFSQQTLYILYKLQRWLTAKICGTIHNTNTYTTELWTNCLLCVHFWYTYQPSGLSILILFLYIIIPRLRCCIDINLHSSIRGKELLSE